MYNEKLLNPVIVVGHHELIKMHSHSEVEQAREEFKSIKDAAGEPVAFWVPKEQCDPPLANDRWEILDDRNPLHSARIQELRNVAVPRLM